jgi:hypothetical protein
MCTSQGEQKGEKEEHDDSKNDILSKEIDSWSNLSML